MLQIWPPSKQTFLERDFGYFDSGTLQGTPEPDLRNLALTLIVQLWHVTGPTIVVHYWYVWSFISCSFL